MPKRASAAVLQALKLQQQKKEPRYKERRNVLVSKLGAQKASLQLTIEERYAECERQKVLVDFIYCQEEIQRLLQYHDGLLQQAQSTAASEATTSTHPAIASTRPGLVSGNNRFNSLLAAAKAEDLFQVQELQPEDWLKLARETFPKLLVLLELVDRELFAVDDSRLVNGASTAATAAATADKADKDVAPSGAADAVDQELAGTGSSALQQLQCMGDSVLYMVGLAMLHNPTPYYISAACNQITGQMQTAPPQHIQQVLSRLRLTDVQLLHLRIAIEEFERLSRAAQQQGGQLSEQIAKLSLQHLVDGISRQQQQQEREEQEKQHEGSLSGEPIVLTDADTVSTTKGINKQQFEENVEKSTSAKGGAAAAAEVATDSIAADDTARQQLMTHMDHYVNRMNIHTCVTAWFITNTLTARQLATGIVASFPFALNVHAVAEAAKHLHKQQQEDRLARYAARFTEEELLKEFEETEAAAAAAASRPAEQSRQQASITESQALAWDKEVAEHMQHRSAMLQQQLTQWWHDIGATP